MLNAKVEGHRAGAPVGKERTVPSASFRGEKRRRVAAVHSKASPCTLCASGGEAVQQRAEIRGQRSEKIPESRCEFSSEGADGELLMRLSCPELSRPGKADVCRTDLHVKMNDLAQSGVAPVWKPAIRQTWKSAVHWQGWRAPSKLTSMRRQRHVAGDSVIPESCCGFVSHNADGEMVMPQDCPEIRRGKAESGKLKIEIGAPHAEMPEMAESPDDFVLQPAEGKVLMRQDCPEIHLGKSES